MKDRYTEPGKDLTAEHVLQEVMREMTAERKSALRLKWTFRMLLLAYLFFSLLLVYISTLNDDSGDDRDGPYVGIVEVRGDIGEGTDASADKLVPALEKAFEDEKSIGLIIKVNSGGGSPVQSGIVYRAINRLQEDRPDFPVYAVISDLGASGAYFIASAADDIYADPASLVGSIGVIGSSFGFEEVMDKVGVERRQFISGKYKGLLDPYSPLKDEEAALWQDILDNTHQQFIKAVQEGRGDRLGDSVDLFTGLFWTGEQALELGLIDGFETERTLAKRVFETDEFKTYTKQSRFGSFLKQFGVSIGEGIAHTLKRDALEMK